MTAGVSSQGVVEDWEVAALAPHLAHLRVIAQPTGRYLALTAGLMAPGRTLDVFDIVKAPRVPGQPQCRYGSFLTDAWENRGDGKIFRELSNRHGGIVACPPQFNLENWFNRAKEVTTAHGTVAFRLPASFDSDMLYRRLFYDESTFYKKIVLFRTPFPGMIPHMYAWYIWRHGYGGSPLLYYCDEGKIKENQAAQRAEKSVATSS